MSRLRISLSIAVCLAWTLLPARPQSDELTKRFIGAWRLVSVEGHPPGLSNFYGEHPTGIIIYDPSGWMTAQVATGSNRPSWPRNGKGFHAVQIGRTAEEKAAAFDTYAAYYGKYTIDANAGTVTHHLEDSSLPSSRGVNNIRYFQFQGGDRLLLSVAEDGKGGLLARKDTTYKIFWERIK